MADIQFNNARGAASSLQMSPPFAFSDVTMSVFPLRASLPTLDNFCRNYLNQAPDLVQFRPFVPFVYLVILDYGRMSLEAANMGWVSQREVAFGVPLRWLHAVDGGLEFHDWAFSSPFIFVDNELSMSTGREVYGWPKLLARLDPSVSEWVRNPHGARRVFQVSTKGASEGYVGETSSYRPLLSVYQHRTAGLMDIPPNMDAIVKPLGQMSNAAAGLTRLGADLAKTFVGMASDRITGSSVLPDMFDMTTLRAQLEPAKMRQWRSINDWLPGVKDALWSLFPRMYANTINFKQFRDAGDPHATCYQALTAARMPVKAFKEGGFLGPQNMMLGQLDGGFRIDIHHLASLPIIESLGLEVSEEREADGTLVSSLTPVAPLWMKVDMTYGLADTLIWRGRSNGWTEGEALTEAKALSTKLRSTKSVVEELIEDIRPRSAADDDDFTESFDPPVEPDTEEDQDALDDGQGFDYIRAMNIFNTSRGASEAVGGSFRIPNASVRVLPLKADSETLQRFVRDYLRIEKAMRFEAWGDFVYLVISDLKQMDSEQSALSKRRARELSLMVPVKCYKWFPDGAYAVSGHEDDAEDDNRTLMDRGRNELLTTGFVNAFNYVDDVETAITANEVFGVPSMGSTIHASENEWLSRDLSRERTQHEILTMRAQVLPELMAGAQAVERTLVDVSTHHPHHEAVQESQDEAITRWISVLADDLGAKRAEADNLAVKAGKGFALKLLGGELSFNQFALKQFRDSAKTQNACYQGLIQRRHTIKKLTDFREIEAPVHVSITDYPTQPITEILGLKPKFSYPGRDRLVKVFEAVRPFSLNGDLRRGAGVTLFERVNTEDWKRVDITEEIFGWRRLPRNEIERFVGKVEDGVPIEVAFDFNNPETGETVQKRIRRSRKVLWEKWYERHVKTNRVHNVMVRQRGEEDVLPILFDDACFEDFANRVDVDIASWNAQMVGKQKPFRQQTLAMLMEDFKPSTVLDKILSRRWGIARGSEVPQFAKSDFCVPVNSVPRATADALFPHCERLNGYWPQSYLHFKFQMAQRKSEIAAFKVELHSAIHRFARDYPGALYDQFGDDVDHWSLEKVLTRLSEVLNEHTDASQITAAKKHTKLAAEKLDSDSDYEGLYRAAEKVIIHFFEAHLPPIFRFSPTKDRKKFFEREREHPMEIPATAQDWKEARDGLSTAADIIPRNVRNKDEVLEIVEVLILPFVGRAARNYEDLAAFEAHTTFDASQMPQEITQPDRTLRKRLHKVTTGLDLPD